jgi:hypothetical protein
VVRDSAFHCRGHAQRLMARQTFHATNTGPAARSRSDGRTMRALVALYYSPAAMNTLGAFPPRSQCPGRPGVHGASVQKNVNTLTPDGSTAS